MKIFRIYTLWTSWSLFQVCFKSLCARFSNEENNDVGGDGDNERYDGDDEKYRSVIFTSNDDLVQNTQVEIKAFSSIFKVGCKKLILLLWQEYAAWPDKTRVCYIGGCRRAKFRCFPALDLHFSFPLKLPLAKIYIFPLFKSRSTEKKQFHLKKGDFVF